MCIVCLRKLPMETVISPKLNVSQVILEKLLYYYSPEELKKVSNDNTHDPYFDYQTKIYNKGPDINIACNCLM